jgi:hypothetical protein
MPHQVALTIVAEVKPGEADELKRLLLSLDDDGPAGDGLPFKQLDAVHFARLFVLDETKDLAGERIPAQLVFLTDLDAPLHRYLRRLGDLGGATLDKIFRHCEAYPEHATPARRVAYLRARTISAAAFYVNTVGRSVRQIRQEARLRDAVQAFLDRSAPGWAGRNPDEVRAAVQAFVRGDASLRWALEPARPPSLLWRIKDKLHLAAGVLVLLLLSPLIVLAAPFYLVGLRWHELTDPTPRLRIDQSRVEELAEREDHAVQNPLSAVGLVKPGRFRLLTVAGVLRAVDFGVRHLFNRGSLAGITTIHFARWVFVDDRRRIFFASSYDGSLESYMDDFIDKVYWGLNAVFSNGVGYPRTSWLVREGAKDEQAFKAFLRTGQVVTQYWYSAYDQLTAVNVANNAAIRAGLSGSMSDEEIRRWLRRL